MDLVKVEILSVVILQERAGKKMKKIRKSIRIALAFSVAAAGIFLIPQDTHALEREFTQPLNVEQEALPETDIENQAEERAGYSSEYAGELAENQTSDLSEFSNTLEMLPVYGSSPNTYLEQTDSGYEAVLIDGKVHVIDFDENWNQVSERTLDYELEIFGGYFAGEKFNYLVFGQSGNTAGTEIYRVVKYDKNFNRIASLSIPYEDCYTIVPFNAGEVSIAENGNEMVIYTARNRPDGHQSNIAIRLNTDTMTVSDYSGMSTFADVHVSHSFRQIVKYDGENPVYVDLGDGAPRAVCLQEHPGAFTNMLDIAGQTGDNVTDTDVSGLEITDTGYLVVGTQLRNYCNNIYLSYAKKGEKTAGGLWLTANTTYNYSTTCNAKIIKIANDKYAVMWNKKSGGSSVDYVMVNGEGEPVSSLKSVPDAELTQCEPILVDDHVVWLKYVNGEMSVLSLNDFSCTGTYDVTDTYVEPVHPWDGTADTEWYSDGKSEFILNTPQQLAGLAQLVNAGNTFEGKTIKLGEDMFFNEIDSTRQAWIPIASEDSGVEFQGTFDGQGHTLYNMYIRENAGGGLFGTVGENGIIKALKISQGVIRESAAVAKLNKGWILFCVNNSYVVNYADIYVGGVCGENQNLVYGCGNTGVVEAGSDGGGVVGRGWGKDSTIDSCWNEGYVVSGGGNVGGIVAANYGWILDCYNSGTVSGSLWLNYAKTVGGLIGQNYGSGTSQVKKIRNCYNASPLDIDEEWNWYNSDTVCGGHDRDCENVYSVPSQYNNVAEEISVEQLKSPDAAQKLNGSNVIERWTEGTEEINYGMAVPAARADMEKGNYKILPDVWSPVSEVNIKLSDENYKLNAFRYAYYGMKDASAEYSTESSIISITPDGVITPKKEGTAIVHVTFKGSEHIKESGFDVTVIVSGMKGDITGDGNADISDLRLVLRAVCGKVELTDAQTSAADVETDGKVDIQDLRKILRFVCGKVETL